MQALKTAKTGYLRHAGAAEIEFFFSVLIYFIWNLLFFKPLALNCGDENTFNITVQND
jgi:hypothetical protein